MLDAKVAQLLNERSARVLFCPIHAYWFSIYLREEGLDKCAALVQDPGCRKSGITPC